MIQRRQLHTVQNICSRPLWEHPKDVIPRQFPRIFQHIIPKSVIIRRIKLRKCRHQPRNHRFRPFLRPRTCHHPDQSLKPRIFRFVFNRRNLFLFQIGQVFPIFQLIVRIRRVKERLSKIFDQHRAFIQHLLPPHHRFLSLPDIFYSLRRNFCPTPVRRSEQ